MKNYFCAGGSILGVKFLDPLAGLVVSAMIFKAGLETGHQRYSRLPPCVCVYIYVCCFSISFLSTKVALA